MSCESAELFDSTGLRVLKRRLGLLCTSAFADDTVLLQPAFKGSWLVRLHSDQATTIRMGALQDGFARVFT